MRVTAKNKPVIKRLVVEWLEQPGAQPMIVGMRKARRTSFPEARRGFGLRGRGLRGDRRLGRLSAFTLLELLVVMAIIGFIAAMALPHVGGFNRANGVTAATRQLMDDVARARNRALVNRSTVYMVFVPSYSGDFNSVIQEKAQLTPQLTNLLEHQFVSYAIISDRTVGDQPGQHYPHYLTEWQTLPSGVFIWPMQFNSQFRGATIRTTNTINNTTNADYVYGFASNSFPFPSINAGTYMNLPYIGFTPQGTLLTSTNQYITLTRGSIFYPETATGPYQPPTPLITEAPPGNESNNPCMIKIDWLTARPTIVQNQFQ
ncbi:MAG TPA: prepilin-type N-terminal cleavage/methylation domain-containing protein [Verrucomicrobiae bacterium]|jgi:prepilin-type N-terminal cleavage/methylation domain-containing protein